MSAANDIKRFTIKTASKLEAVKKGACIELFSRIIVDTPVDTSNLQSNWNATTGEPSEDYSGHLLDLHPSLKADNIVPPEVTVARMKDAVEKSDVLDTVYLTNSAPYIGYVEYGTANAPPVRMVGKNCGDFEQIIQQVERSIK